MSPLVKAKRTEKEPSSVNAQTTGVLWQPNAPPVQTPNGLDISLLERLMTVSPYTKGANGGYDPFYITMLLDNYRSHPTIIHVPSGTVLIQGVIDWTAVVLVFPAICVTWDCCPKINKHFKKKKKKKKKRT